MKRTILTSAILAAALALAPTAAIAQNHRGGGGNHRGGQSSSMNSTRHSGNAKAKPDKMSGRPGNINSRPGNSAVSRPGGNSSVRPSGNHGNNGNHSGTRPGGNNFNPGHSKPNPGHSKPNPGHSKPNPGHSKPNPGHNPGLRPGGHNWGHSAPRPGVGATPSPRPHYNYRPPRIHRWERPLPPRPRRISYRPVYVVPSISSVLGLTFGTLLDYGINSLLNAGYNIAGTYNNTIYLNNVNQFGMVWPQASIYYGPSGMSSARFQYCSYAPNQSNFYNVYNALCSAYGAPVDSENINGVKTYTWWGGNNTGYITLQYGPGLTEGGSYQYYTDLIIGSPD